MLNKFTVSMLTLLVVAGIILFGGFAQYFGMAVTIIIPLLAVLAWYNNISNRREEKITPLVDSIKNDPNDSEYHNDFSKVPAGTADQIQPLPRSIGYGYGDGGRSTIEDLERIGIKTTNDKKNE